jgi:hypothetical protein
VREYVFLSICVETSGQYLAIGNIVDGMSLNPRRLNEDMRGWGRRRDELERKLRLTPEARAALNGAGRQTIDLHQIQIRHAIDDEVADQTDRRTSRTRQHNALRFERLAASGSMKSERRVDNGTGPS